MGHSGCGAVKEALNYAKDEMMPSDDLTALVHAIQPAVMRAKGKPGDPLVNAIKANAVAGAETLRKDAILAAAMQKHQLKIVPAYVDLATGKVSWL